MKETRVDNKRNPNSVSFAYARTHLRRLYSIVHASSFSMDQRVDPECAKRVKKRWRWRRGRHVECKAVQPCGMTRNKMVCAVVGSWSFQRVRERETGEPRRGNRVCVCVWVTQLRVNAYGIIQRSGKGEAHNTNYNATQRINDNPARFERLMFKRFAQLFWTGGYTHSLCIDLILYLVCNYTLVIL